MQKLDKELRVQQMKLREFLDMFGLASDEVRG